MSKTPAPRLSLLAFHWISCGLIVLIFGVPMAAVVTPFLLGDPGPLLGVVLLLLAPIEYATLFVLVAGLLSMPYQRAIVPGRFPRDLSVPLYRARRLYGLCWTAVYYFKPLYWAALSLPPLKRLLFRLFGYRGSMDFTIYPDTWIRDLPLLDFGEGAYISNRVTLGTNVGMSDGTLLVDRITVGRGALVGHLAMVACGTVLEPESEVGVGCALGIRVRLHEGALLSPCCTLGHAVTVGPAATVGTTSHVGSGARVEGGARVAPGTLVPDRERVAARNGKPRREEGPSLPAWEGVADLEDDAVAIRRRPFE
jgi:carbonic anhydrase/acetyltransferase-like protein (isoleucine patch superfamily)